jgi:hypothetical protein
LVVGRLSVDFPPSGAKSTQSRYTGAKSTQKRLHGGQSQLVLGFGGSSTRATHSSPRHASHAPPPRTAMHLRRAQPCRRRLAAASRKAHAGCCRLARIPSRAGLASHHLPGGFCISYSASAPTTAPYPGRYLLPTRATPTTSAPPLATRCTTARPRLPAPSRQTTRRRRLSPLTSENHPNLSKPI